MNPKDLVIGHMYISKPRNILCTYIGISDKYEYNYVFKMSGYKYPQHVGPHYINEFMRELNEKDMAKFL